MPRRGSVTLSQLDLFPPATSTIEASPMSSPAISVATPNATSLPDLAGGPMPPVSPDGPTTGHSGPVPAPVNRSRSREKAGVTTTNGICGLSSIDSLPPAGLPLFLENKSQTPPEPETSKGKTCGVCGERKPFRSFYADKKGRTRKTCIECCKTTERQRKTGTKAARSASHQKWRRENRASTLITAARYRAKQRGLAFDLDEWKPQIEERINRGACELTGLPLNLDGGRTWDSPSLDRIDPKEGYTISNTRIVLFALNVMMNTWGQNKVLEIAEALKTKMLEAENHPLAAWEAALKRRLSHLGSTEFPLTWKQSVTPAGHPISRLVPLTRRTEETGSGLSPWPTPKYSDHKPGLASRATDDRRRNLNDAVSGAAHWPTPQVDSFRSRSGNRKHEMGLDQLARSAWATPAAQQHNYDESPESFRARQERLKAKGINGNGAGTPLGIQAAETALWATPTSLAPAKDGNNEAGNSAGLVSIRAHIMAATEPSGPTTSGSPGQTEKHAESRGSLNPAFVCWLMGFPPEYLSCAPSETRSSRKSRPK